MFEATRARLIRFIKFQERSHLHSGKVKSETASTDVEAAASYSEGIIDEENCTKQQIFNVNRTVLFSEMITFRLFIAREKKSVPFFKISEGSLIRGKSSW